MHRANQDTGVAESYCPLKSGRESYSVNISLCSFIEEIW